MHTFRKQYIHRVLMIVLSILLLAGSFGFSTTAMALPEPGPLEITGDGVTNPTTFSLSELQAMDQEQYVYSAINTWPSKKWYVGKGVNLRNLLKQAGIRDDAKQIKFTARDGYTVTLTVKELLEDKRYCFPKFKSSSTDGDGHLPGSPADAKVVEPIVALVSAEGSDNPKYMNTLNSLILMMGQRVVTEQTGNLFVKYLTKIEVLTAAPEKWDAPQANPGSGVVAPGTMVALSNANMDDDKVYYTTDGSTPTLNSPMYNWIARRWWSARAEDLGKINKPIGPITKDTVIKAITIGPGKEDSDVVTFTYKIGTPGDSEPGGDPGKDQPGEMPDVTGHWARGSINRLVALGCMGGYPDGSFKPDREITRAEFATVLVKAFKLENQGGKTFADTANHWAKESISVAASNGIVNGYDAKTFGPDDPITREQMACMIVNAAKLAPAAGTTGFTDNSSISGWAREGVITVVNTRIMGGYPDNTFRPRGRATRAEAATVIIKAIGG